VVHPLSELTRAAAKVEVAATQHHVAEQGPDDVPQRLLLSNAMAAKYTRTLERKRHLLSAWDMIDARI